MRAAIVVLVVICGLGQIIFRKIRALRLEKRVTRYLRTKRRYSFVEKHQ